MFIKVEIKSHKQLEDNQEVDKKTEIQKALKIIHYMFFVKKITFSATSIQNHISAILKVKKLIKIIILVVLEK